MPHSTTRIALLIDSDNASPTHIAGVLAELASFGSAQVRRMYGDWTTGRLRGWKEAANEYSLQPMQQFAYTTGKNSTDSALIIDAMDLLHQENLDAFAIVSSDSDFTRLAARIRESGARVFGFGARQTPKAFVNACDRFTYFDVLAIDESLAPSDADSDQAPSDSDATQMTKPPRRVTSKELRQDTHLMNLLRAGIAANADDDGWAPLSSVGSTMRKQSPDFDSRNWGYGKLGDLVEAVGLFDVNRFKEPSGYTNIRVKTKARK